MNDKIPHLMKNRNHFFRMNPQTIRRPKGLITPTKLASFLFASALVALYWLGRLETLR